MKLASAIVFLSFAALSSLAYAQPPSAIPIEEIARPQISIALTPAVIMVRGRPGQSTTQTLTIINHTGDEVRFKLATEDVVVKDGKRLFSAAGLIADGIAASAVASPASVIVKAGEEASVQVTLTLPPQSGQ